MIVFDTECYQNTWMIGFKNIDTQVVRTYTSNPETMRLDDDSIEAIKRILHRRTVVGFNSISYDMPLIAMALSGATTMELKVLSDTIIQSKDPSWMVCKRLGIPRIECDHIDLFNVAPGDCSLKIYGGRLHCPKMQDLPYAHDMVLTPEEINILRHYMLNDLDITEALYRELEPRIVLRKAMGERYGLDLRSKSDAQIAEAVIRSHYADKPKPHVPPARYSFFYKPPSFIKFNHPDLNELYKQFCDTRFRLTDTGKVDSPTWLHRRTVSVGDAKYKMGIGGIHSSEKGQYVEADEDNLLLELDVTSYYPNIMLQQGMYPKGLGAKFLDIFQGILDTRLIAKKKKDKDTSEMLKIVVNGTFGKLGSRFSIFYSPELLVQVTVTGQLALLMLIERLEAAGIRVVSANTDGLAILCPRKLEGIMEDIAFDWMLDTSFHLERTDYLRMASRDVNNYIAVKMDKSTKGKGIFAPPSLAKTPDHQVVFNAVANFLTMGTPIEETICTTVDMGQFVNVRQVTSGGEWNGNYLGKAVRFYRSNQVPKTDYIRYVKNGNKVSNSDGCRPLMDFTYDGHDLTPMPEKDLDLEGYVAEAYDLLKEIGWKNYA